MSAFIRKMVGRPISKKLATQFIVLGLATSVSALGIAVGTADPALAFGGKGGGRVGGGGGGGMGGGHGWGGGGGGHGWGGAAHFSAAHIGGGRHFSASHISHASHWSGGHHYSTRYSGHTHTAGIHNDTTNLSKTNLSHSNATDHSWKNAGQDKNLNGKNLNEHVSPLKNASDPKNFGSRRDFSNKTAFNSFWREGWHNNWWHHNHFFHIGWIGPLFWPYA